MSFVKVLLSFPVDDAADHVFGDLCSRLPEGILERCRAVVGKAREEVLIAQGQYSQRLTCSSPSSHSRKVEDLRTATSACSRSTPPLAKDCQQMKVMKQCTREIGDEQAPLE